MQGHFEGSQPSPYSSISVNNPSRYTNSNLVNRRYTDQAQQQSSTSPPMPIKPVIPRRRTVNNAGHNAMNQMMPSQQMMPSTSHMNQMSMNQDTTSSDVMSLRSPSPHHSSATHTPVTTPIPHNLTQDIKPNIQNLQYNGMPIVPNIPNMEIATLFFNQNFTQQNHQN